MPPALPPSLPSRRELEAEARQREVRAKILALIGGLPEKTPLNARSLGTTQADGFRIEKILFDSQPNFPVTALLYLPDPKPGAPQQKLPAIVVAPGHGATGKASDYGFASTFARNGFAVLSYDPIGQGERLQYPDPAHPGQSLATRPTGEHGEAGLQPTLLGDAVARYFAWDGIRAVDYLISRPEIDPDRIGAFGCSGGGAMTALLGALDPRIKAIGTACYITSFDTLLPAIGPQDAEQSIPNFIASGLDFPDWVELAAPRPYAIIATTADMFPFAGAQKTEAEARRFYVLFDANADLEFLTGPGGHGNLRPIQPIRIVSFVPGIGGHGNLRPLQSQIARSSSSISPTPTPTFLPPPPARDQSLRSSGRHHQRRLSGHTHWSGSHLLPQRRDCPYAQSQALRRAAEAQAAHHTAATASHPRGHSRDGHARRRPARKHRSSCSCIAT